MTAQSRPGQLLLLLLLVLTLSLVSRPSSAAPAPVTIQVDGRVVPFVVSPFLGDDGVVYTPVDLIYRLGGSYTGSGGDVVVTSAAGATTNLTAKVVDSRYIVPVPALIEAAGLHGGWALSGHTLTITTTPDVVPQSNADAAASGLTITGLVVAAMSDTLTRVTVTTNGPAQFRTVALDNPSRLAFDLMGARLASNVTGAAAPENNPLIRAIRTGLLPGDSGSAGRIVFDLAGPVAAAVSQETAPDGTVTYTIDLRPGAPPSPENSNLTPISDALKGRIVMVDPGHGGSDTGALGIGGAREKDITLKIGRQLRDDLIRNGATVYMTRNDDVLPSVHARPLMAIAANADYFISVHCDSSGGTDSHAGSTVYYHAHDPICRQMASCFINRIAAVSGIPSNGVRSDTIRFQTGFGVLRGSPMPAVLVECGYMNNHKDLAKLVTSSVQQTIANAIVAGLIDFDTELHNR